MNNNIKITVLTPCYCHRIDYVRRCLESLKKQTFMDCEFILIDNEANEENKNLIEEFCQKDSRFRALHIEHNEGYGKAMNLGLRSAKGEFIGIVESDDFVEPHMFDTLYKYVYDATVDIVKSAFTFHEDKKGIVKKAVNVYPQRKYKKILRNIELCELPMFWAAQWTAIYRKNMLENNNIVWSDVKGASHQDMGFMMKTWMAAKGIVVIPDILYFYRRDNENSSFTKDNTVAWGDAKEYQLLEQWMMNNNHLISDKLWHIYSRREFLNKFYFYSIVRSNKIRFFLNELSKRFKRQILENRIDFSIFTEKEKKLYKKIAFSPYRYLLRECLKKYVFCVKKSKSSKICNFLGIPIYKVHISEKYTTKSYLGGLAKSQNRTNNFFKFKILGISFISKLDTEKRAYLKLFGITLYKTSLDQRITNHEQNNRNLIEQINRNLIEQNNRNLIEQNNCNLIKKNSELILERLAVMKTLVEAQALHANTFGKYKRAFYGKDCVLVCTGPTAKDYKPIERAIHVGVNGAIYLNNINLDYLFVQDYTIRQKNNSNLTKDCLEYKGNNCKKFFGILPDIRLSQVKHVIERIPLSFSYEENVSQYIIEDAVKHNIAYDLSRDPMGDFCGTAFSALQFILYTHPKRLFIVGWDCSAGYAYNASNAIRPANAQAAILKEYFVPHIRTNYPDIEISVINPVGLKGIFNDILI